ncbi:MAG: OsmC family peroxiredoxin [Methylococcaceae bacterium]|nr:MAG: OsmC family peroxiredoxin [Methylococcaceae bacterium]
MCPTICGIATSQVIDTINLFNEQPELGQFRFKATADWIDAGRSRITIHRKYGVAQGEDPCIKSFEFESEEPPILIGSQVSGTPHACPVELILSALASCLTMGVTYNAAVRKIRIDTLRIDVQGDIDFRGYLGIPVERMGYHHIQINCDIKSSATDEEIAELMEYVRKTSPVLDIIGNSLKEISFNISAHGDSGASP